MYTKIESIFWSDEKVTDLSFHARYLMLYILTTTHRNILGLFFLPEAYMCYDTGLSNEQFQEGFAELLGNGLVKYDSKAKIILVKNFLKYNPIENPNQTKSAINKLNELPQTELFNDFLNILSNFIEEKPFIEPLRQRLQERLCKGLPQPVSSNQYTVISINTLGENSFADENIPEQIEQQTSAASFTAPDDDQSENAKKTEKPEKKVNETRSPHKEIIDYFYQKHLDVLGVKYLVDGGKDGKLIQALLKVHNTEFLKEFINWYFETDDDFINTKAGRSIGGLKAALPKFITIKKVKQSYNPHDGPLGVELYNPEKLIRRDDL